MKKILLTLAILFTIPAIQADETMHYSDISAIECTAGNMVGISRFTYNSYMGYMLAYTMSVLGPSVQAYAIQNVVPATKFGATDYEFGKISFRSANSANTLDYMLVTATPIQRGTHVYSATWGNPVVASVFGGPATLIPIANTVCTITVL